MHLALQHKHYHIARALVTLDLELIRIRGRCGITPLHYVAGKDGDDELELLTEFLSACRLSIEDLTSRCETAVHIAVKNHNLKAFKVLFGWLKRVRLTQLLNWKDQDGNTALHIAASEGQLEIIKLLIGYTPVNAKNLEGKTALEIFQMNPSGDPNVVERLRRQGCRARLFTPTLSLSQFFSREPNAFEKCANFFRVKDESARNIILIVSTLIVVVTYKAIVSPPGGFRQDSSSNPMANSNSTVVTTSADSNSTVITTDSSGSTPGKLHQAGSVIQSGWNQCWSWLYSSRVPQSGPPSLQ
ncbi:hypothetical protein BT93_E1729 [Corymbia citriodora subsp. variegata]|nr:hypothetical protein BT93_E1729 [Corymbia citriodora subsp. variegata]